MTDPASDEDFDPAAPASDGTWSIPTSAPRTVARKRRWLRPVAVWTARVIGTLATIGFALMGWLRSTSLDVPFPGNRRIGFYQNTAPQHWICSELHEHWSLPYWMGSVMVGVPTVVVWLTAARLSVGAPPSRAPR